MISASKTSRALNCPGSFSLPQVEEEESEHAARGTVIHTFMENTRKLGRDVALTQVPAEHLAACEAIDVDWLVSLGGEVLVEAGFSLDVKTGIVSYHGEHLAHGQVQGDITGIADLVIITDKAVVVLDYKTGRMVERAQDNPQLLTLASLVEGHFRLDLPIEGAIVYLWEGSAFFDRAAWDAFDLAAHASALLATYHRILARSPDIRTGSWCRYCPAFMACPAKVALMKVAAEGRLSAAVGEALAQDHAAAAVQTLAELKGLVGYLHNQLQNYVLARGPIDLGNGKEWGPRESKRESLDGRKTYNLLRDSFGPDVAMAAVSLEATKTALRDALRPVAKAKGTTIVSLERDALKALAAEGGIETKTSTTFDTHPKK